MGRPILDVSILIDSNVDLLRDIGSVHEKIDVWTGPYENINLSAWNNVLGAASSIQADEDVELAG